MSRFRYLAGLLCFAIPAAIMLSASLVLPSTAWADPSPWLTAVGDSGPNTVSDTIGYEVTLGATPLQLTALGVWDDNGDGLLAAHDVGVWNSNGTVLDGYVSIPSGIAATLVNGYRYATFSTPINLAANTTYVIGASYNSDDAYDWFPAFGDSANNHTAGGITIKMGHYGASTSLIYPMGTSSSVYTGPNALFTPLPEPSAALLMLPLGWAAFLRRRRPAQQ